MKSVIFCGSSKHMAAMKEWGEYLTANGVEAFIPEDYSSDLRWSGTESDRQAIANELTRDHFDRIAQHDVAFIFNVDGYTGPSTTMEIGCAYGNGKEIYALSHDADEVCRDVLFTRICLTKEALLQALS